MHNLQFYQSINYADCYYIVDNRKTFNRYTAISWANGDLNKIKFYWMDDVWSKVDLSKEPTQTWSQLMRDRCLQLRSKTNFLSLNYSSGYDSQTILDYFLINNIHLDELLICDRLDHVHQRKMHGYSESDYSYQVALEIKKNYMPNIKITVWQQKVEHNLAILDYAKDDWMFYDNFFSFSKTIRLNKTPIVDTLEKNLGKTDQIGIDGFEKPRVLIENGQWVMVMPDTTAGWAMNSPYAQFYTSSDFPELHLKQTWMMINWLESKPFESVTELENYLHFIQSYNSDINNAEWQSYIGRTPANNFISWNSMLNGKRQPRNPNSGFENETFDHFNLHNNPIIKRWKSAGDYFKQQYPKAFNSNSSSKIIWSKFHPIKKVELGRTQNQLIV